MERSFTHAVLGRTGIPVHRLGLSASYLPGRATIHRAVDAGLNYFFCYGFDFQMVGALREVPKTGRERYVVATGPYNLIWGHTDVRRTLEKRLRQLGTDYVDVFLFLGVMKPKELPGRVLDDLRRLREEGRVRAIGLSTHDRRLAGHLAGDGAVDVLMVRYNAAHRGAEEDIFPHLQAHDPGVVAYTATRWTALLRRPRGWPKHGRVPTAGECYRFVLSSPHVDVCMTAPRSVRELDQNLAALERGPLDEDEMAFLRQFGDAVHAQRRWFM
jgi:aryl-alcohol dehydrogenase-like predicted oxidoreductase